MQAIDSGISAIQTSDSPNWYAIVNPGHMPCGPTKYSNLLQPAFKNKETTTIIEDRAKCFDIITDGFRFINEYCKHWN